MKLTKISIQRPVTTIMIMLIVILLGAISMARLPVDLFPDMSLPYAIVLTSYDGAGPREIETLLTRPLEGQLGTVSNLKSVSSTSSNGSSMVVLEFNAGTNMDFATLDIREKIDMIKGFLPDDIGEPMVIKIDPNMMASMEIGISGSYDLAQLNQIVEDRIINRLERISGVASVGINGGQEKEIQITLDSSKLKGYNITPSTIASILRAENINLPGGEIKHGNKTLTLRSIGEFNSIDEIRNLPIPLPGTTIYLRDIATVEETYKEMKNFSYINGRPSVNLSIQKQSTANTVEVSKAVHKTLDEISKDMKELEITLITDSARFIQSSISNVASSAIIGGILAILILFVFLRNVRSTLIIGISIPVSIISVFSLMYFGGLTLNIVSLGGLSLGVGMLVDNSIVVLENIYRFRQNGYSSKEAADQGASEVGLAILASTLTTVAVFLPVVFVEGIAADVFKDMALTVTFSLLASLIVALTVVPMLSSKLLKVETSQKIAIISKVSNIFDKGLNNIDLQYRKLLNWCIHHRKSTAIITLVIFLASLALVPFVGMELMPSTDEGEFAVSISLPKGTIIDETFEIVDQVEKRIKEIAEVKQISYSVGGSNIMLGGDSSANAANFSVYVGKVNERKRGIDEIVNDTRKKLSDISGAEISVAATSSSMGVMLGGKPIVIQISGDDLSVLNNIALDLMQTLETIPGFIDVTSSVEEGSPEAQLIVDRNKASRYGLNMITIANALQSAVGGSVATQYKIDGTEIDVKIQYDKSEISYLPDLNNITVNTPSGSHVSLDEVASIQRELGPVSISRSNQKRTVTVDADLIDIDTATAQKLIDQRMSSYNMPDGYSYDYTGETEEMMKSFESLGLALILAIVLVYMVLASQFESLIHPFTIMFSVPISLTGAMFALFISNMNLSMPAFIGLIMLAGIVVNNAIVLVDYIIILRGRGQERSEAILNAGPTRLRPILMTTLTTVLGMIPMALGIGEGTELMAPLAVAVIGGLSLSTVLTLVIIPVNYLIFDDIIIKIKGIFFKDKQKNKNMLQI
jgi:HAE1 family hydrophobic/amphiphilic exporter-1